MTPEHRAIDILECDERRRHMYDDFGQAFDKHNLIHRDDKDRLQRWILGLIAASIVLFVAILTNWGYSISANSRQDEAIRANQEVVKEIKADIRTLSGMDIRRLSFQPGPKGTPK